jgi:TfoX/Sxy family transcriptional regulator of competence genes
VAYDELFADRVANTLTGLGATYATRKMMGGIVFMVNGNMCVGVATDKETGEHRLMARIGRSTEEATRSRPGQREMAFTGRKMKDFVFVYPEGTDREEDLTFWVQAALDFVGQLPPK